MEVWYGKENNKFMFGFNMIGFNHDDQKSETDPLANELEMIQFALTKLNAKQINFSLTSLDRYVKEFLVNSSLVTVIGDNYENVIYSQNEKVILEIGKIMEEKLNSKAA